MARVNLKKIKKVYPGNVTAVFESDLDIHDKEFMVLVGPSGCGKSTTLRMVAGLEEISSGDLEIAGKRVNDVSPKDRDIAMVFQNYALYPHMTVYDNMAFGLKLRKYPKKEIAERVQAAAKSLGLEDYLERKPKALSGGQRQRVALGRAIVRQPAVFLLDEPLSNLDAKMRVTMRKELKLLHQNLQTTMIYVTHDQIEAMTLGDRICVMSDGWIQQVGKPLDVYDYPANKFVAGFIGMPPMNFFEGALEGSGDNITFKSEAMTVDLGAEKSAKCTEFSGKKAFFGVRSENLAVSLTEVTGADADHTFKGEVEVIEKLGDSQILYVKVGGQSLVAKVEAHIEVAVGRVVSLTPEMKRSHVFAGENDKNITL